MQIFLTLLASMSLKADPNDPLMGGMLSVVMFAVPLIGVYLETSLPDEIANCRVWVSAKLDARRQAKGTRIAVASNAPVDATAVLAPPTAVLAASAADPAPLKATKLFQDKEEESATSQGLDPAKEKEYGKNPEEGKSPEGKDPENKALQA